MKKKVMIYAYANFNLGDDLFIKILCERYPNTQFLLYAPSEYKDTLENIGNISIFSSNKLLYRLFNYTMRLSKMNTSIQGLISGYADAIVHIGGSIFMQKGKWTGVKGEKKKPINKPFYVLGANFGPYQEEQFYKDHYNLFQQYKDVCFRDTYSYELFKELNNVRMADDIVFQLSNKRKVSKKSTVVISVIKPSYRENLSSYDKAYFKKIKELAVYFSERGYEIVLMSFCENEGDKEAIEKIMNEIPKEHLNRVNSYYYKFNIEEALDIIASSSFVIATRFHAMILGWVFNKPVFPIAYSEKMNNVMKDLGYKGSYISLKEIDTVSPKSVYETMERNTVDVSLPAKGSKKHFHKLDEFLL